MGVVTGVITNITEKKSANGDRYTIVDLEGEEQGFFDWEGHAEAAGVSVGDRAKIQHSGGEYRRIQSVDKLSSAGGKKSAAKTGSEGKNSRDVQIARQCAVKAAACLLQDSDVEYQERASEVVVLAERLEQWILR